MIDDIQPAQDWFNWDNIPIEIERLTISTVNKNGYAYNVTGHAFMRPQPWRVPDASTPKWSKCWVGDDTADKWIPLYFLKMTDNNAKYPFEATEYSEWTYSESWDDVYPYCLLADDHEGPPPMGWEGEE